MKHAALVSERKKSPTPLAVALPGLGARRSESDTKQRIAGLSERNTSGPSREHVRHRARTVRARVYCRARLRSTHRCDLGSEK
eukprot:6962437-Prymnesium_polylepis.1